MQNTRRIVRFLMIAATPIALAACSESTREETAEAANAAGNDVENAGERVENSMERAGDNMEAAADRAEARTGQALEEAGKDMQKPD